MQRVPATPPVRRLPRSLPLAACLVAVLLAADAPASAQPPYSTVMVVGHPVSLRLEADRPHVSFHLYDGASTGWMGGSVAELLLRSHGYQPICTAPCDIELGQGQHHMGLSRGQGVVVDAREPVEIHGPATLVGRYRSRAGVRIAGWVLLMAGNLAGAAMIPIGTVAMTSESFGPSQRGGVAILGTGAALMLGSLIAALVMVSRQDVAWIDVVPDHGPVGIGR